ncbi:hypothetical protein GCM10025734_02110 [Kitasatospora paranensis]
MGLAGVLLAEVGGAVPAPLIVPSPAGLELPHAVAAVTASRAQHSAAVRRVLRRVLVDRMVCLPFPVGLIVPVRHVLSRYHAR